MEIARNPRRDTGEMVEFTCVYCGKKNRKRLRRDGVFRFCNTSCSGSHRIRKINKERDRSGENNSAWKGGRSKNHSGYVVVYAPDHPFTHDHRGIYVFEHRLVMERHIGRYLGPEERVHHINGIKDDNRIENLELFSSNSEHIQKHHLSGVGKRGYEILIQKRKKRNCGVCGKVFVMNSASHKYCKRKSCQMERLRRYKNV